MRKEHACPASVTQFHVLIDSAEPGDTARVLRTTSGVHERRLDYPVQAVLTTSRVLVTKAAR